MGGLVGGDMEGLLEGQQSGAKGGRDNGAEGETEEVRQSLLTDVFDTAFGGFIHDDPPTERKEGDDYVED